MSFPTTLTCPRCGLLNPNSSEMCDCGFNFAPTEKFVLPGAGLSYAGFWIRALALAIDFVAIIIALIAGGLVQLLGVRDYIAVGVAIGLMGLYFPLLESSTWQATPGKRLLKLRVTDEAGRRISFGRAIGRYFAKYASGFCFYIGFIMAAFTKKNQALHDKLAGTVVVKAR